MTQRQPLHLYRLRLPRLASGLLVSSLLLPATLPAFAVTPVTAQVSAAKQAIDLSLPARNPASSTVISSPNDPSQYRTITLANGLQVLLVHDPRADKASAAMDVNAGSAQEPADVPGLAHFLEHMLFISTERYPTPGEFMDFISANSGQTNAYTASDHTNFIFSITPPHFQEALDRFAQFFTASQFKPEFVDRERHAVNSEYQMQMQNDAFRINDVVNVVTNPEHPFHRFSVGSLDTLKDGPAGSLRDRLLGFYNSHYSARNMKLVVMGPQPLSQLEQWVRSSFKDVPDRKVDDAPITVDMVRADQLPLAVTARSQQETPEVQFLFQTTSDIQHMEQQPLRFISALLGSENEGTLLSRLRAKGWATGLSVGSFDSDRHQDLFSIDITLTPEGRQHIDDIQASVFASIDQARQGLDAWRFDEQSLLARQHFRFLQTDTSFERASALAALMQQVPISEVNVAGYRLDKFDPALLRSVLDDMTPKRLIRLYTAPDVQGDKTTQDFHVPYTVEHIKQWPAGKALEGIHIPSRNPFIAQDLTVMPLKAAQPRQLTAQQGMDLWYAPDSSFGTPSVEWRLNLSNSLSARSARDHMLNVLLTRWLNDSLVETLYPAAEAGQASLASTHIFGTTISLAGWRDRQPEVMDTLLRQLQSGEITADSFARVKQRLTDNLRNEEHSTLFRQLVSQSNRRLITPHWSTAQELEALQNLTLQDLIDFRQQWLKELHIQGVVVGNLDEATARKTADVINAQLKPQLPLTADIKPKPLALEGKLPIFRPQTDQKDSAILRFTQGRNDSATETARYMVLGQLINQPFFTQLRTREQLGYVATAREHSILQAPGILYVLQSPTRDSNTLFERVGAWETEFDKTVKSMTPKQLQRYKEALVDSLKERDSSLNDLTDRIWGQLLFGWTRFDRREQLINAVQGVSVKDIQATWHDVRTRPHFDGASDKGIPATSTDITAGLKPFPAK